MNHLQNLVRLLIVTFWIGVGIGAFNFALNINAFLTVSMTQWLVYGGVTIVVLYVAFYLSFNFWRLSK